MFVVFHNLANGSFLFSSERNLNRTTNGANGIQMECTNHRTITEMSDEGRSGRHQRQTGDVPGLESQVWVRGPRAARGTRRRDTN